MGLDKFKSANEKQKAKMNKAFEEANEKTEEKTITESVETANKKSSEKEDESGKKEETEDIKVTPVKKAKEKSKLPGTVGRPRKDPYVKRSVNIPENYLKYLSVQASLNNKGNVNEYIISLIEKDMKKNPEIIKALNL